MGAVGTPIASAEGVGREGPTFRDASLGILVVGFLLSGHQRHALEGS